MWTLAASAFADSSTWQMEQQEQRGRSAGQGQVFATADVTENPYDEPQPNRVWSTVTSPLRALGRTGRSIVRTPTIISETIKGERPFVGERGFMTRGEAEALQDIDESQRRGASATKTGRGF